MDLCSTRNSPVRSADSTDRLYGIAESTDALAQYSLVICTDALSALAAVYLYILSLVECLWCPRVFWFERHSEEDTRETRKRGRSSRSAVDRLRGYSPITSLGRIKNDTVTSRSNLRLHFTNSITSDTLRRIVCKIFWHIRVFMWRGTFFMTIILIGLIISLCLRGRWLRIGG